MHTDNKIFDVKSLAVQTGDRLIFLITYFIAGIFFGIVLIKAEVVS